MLIYIDIDIDEDSNKEWHEDERPEYDLSAMPNLDLGTDYRALPAPSNRCSAQPVQAAAG